MTRICPGCNYARQPTDLNPDWQCPSCHRAYNKIGGTEHAARDREPARTASSSGASSSGIVAWVGALALIAAAAWFTQPMWRAAPGADMPRPAAAQPAVTLYSTEWCGYCEATRRLFAANGIQYTELDIEKTSRGYQEHKDLGGVGVPLIVIGDDLQRGYSEQNLREALGPWMKKGV